MRQLDDEKLFIVALKVIGIRILPKRMTFLIFLDWHPLKECVLVVIIKIKTNN